MKELLLLLVISSANLVFGVPPVASDCCFRYGFGAFAKPCCLENITCEEHDKLVEENKVNPIAGGSFGKHKVCPKDAEEAHRLASATVSPPSDCCFRYGLGAFSKPCCLETITCEEHDQLVEDNKVNPIAGGSFGKHKVCPKDAEEAHRLASATVSPPSDCCFRYGLGAFSKPCCLETITCEEHDQLVEDNKVNPIAGGSFGKHKVCPKDAEEAHRLASGNVSPPSDCCFRYGLGAFSKPCCLKTITCEEHDQLVEDNKVNPIAGGSFGKHKVCPKDAEEAHRLVSGSVSPSSDCCFRYGLGAFSKPCCLETITCEEHDQLVEDNKVNPIAGGSFGKHKVCPKDAEEAHRLVSEKSSGDCCFRYGFGARAIPCCLETITCEEHDKLVEDSKENPIAGGAFGKHSFCPKDAAEAHLLISE